MCRCGRWSQVCLLAIEETYHRHGKSRMCARRSNFVSVLHKAQEAVVRDLLIAEVGRPLKKSPATASYLWFRRFGRKPACWILFYRTGIIPCYAICWRTHAACRVDFFLSTQSKQVESATQQQAATQAGLVAAKQIAFIAELHRTKQRPGTIGAKGQIHLCHVRRNTMLIPEISRVPASTISGVLIVFYDPRVSR